MKNKNLIKKIEAYSNYSRLNKFAEAPEFDAAARKIAIHIPTVICKNGRSVSSEFPVGPCEVHQFMVVSTTAHRPRGWGIVPDDALVFIFLNKDQYLEESEYPDDSTQLSTVQKYTEVYGGIKTDIDNYVIAQIGKSKVVDRKDANNSCFSHCVAIFKNTKED